MQSQQLLSELRTTDRISRQAEIVQSLMDNHNYTRVAIARAAGVSESTVTIRRLISQLEPEFRVMFDDGRLPIVRSAIIALLDIPAHTRKTLIPYLVDRGATTAPQIRAFCQPYRTGEFLRQRKEQRRPSHAAASVPVPANGSGATLPILRDAAVQMCATCEVRAESLHIAEPGYQILRRAIDATCQECGMHQFPAVCEACPFVIFANRLAAGLPTAVAGQLPN